MSSLEYITIINQSITTTINLKLLLADFQWNSCPGCSSGDPCSQVYRGDSAFSEIEAVNMRNFILNSTDVNWQYYVSYHSYSQVCMHAWF